MARIFLIERKEGRMNRTSYIKVEAPMCLASEWDFGSVFLRKNKNKIEFFNSKTISTTCTATILIGI
jgi:hypothetical protein